MDSDNSLIIDIEAIDDASGTLEGIAEEVAGMSDSISESVMAANGAFETMEENVTGLADMMAVDSDSISEDMLAVGTSFDDAAKIAATAAEEIDASVAGFAASTQGAALEAEEALAGVDEALIGEDGLAGAALGAQGSLVTLGIIGGAALLGLKSEITNAVTDATTWNQSLALIQSELKATGDSIPIQQLTDYATQVQNTTNFSDQSALAAEAIILSNKNLAGSYQSIMTLSEDLATKMKTDIPDAAKILASAMTNPADEMRKLVNAQIPIDAQTQKTITALANSGATAQASALLIDALKNSIGGAAQTAADASGAGLTQLGNQLGTLNRHIGDDLLPDLDKFVKAITPIISAIDKWVQAHPALTAQLVLGATALAGLLVGAAGLGIVLPAIAEGISLIASPLGILIAGIVVLAAHFAKDIPVAWAQAKAVFSDFYQYLKDSGAIDLFKAAVKSLADAFEQHIVPAFKNLMQTISQNKDFLYSLGALLFEFATVTLAIVVGAVELVVNAVINLATWFIKIGSWIESEGTKMWDGMITGINNFITAVQNAITWVENLLGKIGHIPGNILGSIGSGISNAAGAVGNFVTTHLAEGGIVSSPTIALVGEAGPEAVIPLSMLGNASAGNLGGGSGGITVYITGTVMSTADQAKQLGDAIARQIGRSLKLQSFR